MKMKPETYSALAARLLAVQGRSPSVRDEYRKRGLSDERYRWDLLRAAVGDSGICDLYRLGLSDSHIDTALRKIMRAGG